MSHEAVDWNKVDAKRKQLEVEDGSFVGTGDSRLEIPRYEAPDIGSDGTMSGFVFGGVVVTSVDYLIKA